MKKLIHKTAVFKLHNPSRRKRAALDRALAVYTASCRELLSSAQPNIDEIEQKATWTDAKGKPRLNARKVSAHLSSMPCPLARDLSSALREALYADVGANLLSYLELRKMNDRTQFPAGRPLDADDEYLSMLALLASGDIEDFDYNDWRNRLTRLSSGDRPTPLFFCRARDFRLTEVSEGTYGVEVNLAPKSSGAQTRYRFPLEMSAWHEREFIEKAKPKAATLVAREGGYFLHVAYEFEVEIPATETILGVDRGVLKQQALAVCDHKGEVILTWSAGQEVREMQIQRGRALQEMQRKFQHVTGRHWKQKHLDERMHIIANQIVSIAKEHSAQVVLEDLNITTRGKFTASQFAKLERMLTYKLPLAGLPSPRNVFAAYSSVICSRCGGEGVREKNNRQSFHCPDCDVTTDADENAAVNIARRLLYRKVDWETRGGYRAFHRAFSSR